MKRAITALALAAALLLSVVACQVYNPTDNSTMYTAMRTEGATSWAAYAEKFEDADADQKYETLMEYETFRKLEKNPDYSWKSKAEWIALYTPLRSTYETAKKAYGDAKKVVDEAGDNASETQKNALAAAETTLKTATAPLTLIYGSVDGLKTLWDKEFDVVWDYNGKL